jgi:hypothetical protein
MNIKIDRHPDSVSGKGLKSQLAVGLCAFALVSATAAGAGHWWAIRQGGANIAARPSQVRSTARASAAVLDPAAELRWAIADADLFAAEYGVDGPTIDSAVDSAAGTPSNEAALLRQAASDAEQFAAAFGVDGPSLDELRDR